jgi:Cu+-exporting ATPase
LKLGAPQAFEALSGRGVKALVGGKSVRVGSPRYMEEQRLDLGSAQPTLESLRGQAYTAVLVSADEQVIGALGIADTLKDGSVEAVRSLQALGVQVVMITGDNRATADAIARQVGIARVLSDVLPDGKADAVKALRAEGLRVGMVGDGINDAPALASADVGIAIGTGTDVAMEASDVTLVSGDLLGVARSIALSKATMRTIRQNLFWAFIYNVILIPVAMLGLLVPMLAAAAMAFSSVFVVTNSLKMKTPSQRRQPDYASDSPKSAHHLPTVQSQ